MKANISNGAVAPKAGTVPYKKISMNLTLKDIENAEALKDRLNERNQASVVSKSMSIVRSLADIFDDHSSSRLFLEKKGGERVEIIIPGLSK
jgi:hypothetical protein